MISLNDHAKKTLWFSGGKDSMACLYLLQDKLSEITVLWCNTQKNHPELLDTVEKAKKLCPHWLEVKVDRDAQWRNNGLPSDLVPLDHTVVGQLISGRKDIVIQSYLQCCIENITLPLMEATKRLGATLAIRGQRADEAHKATTSSGGSVDGIVFYHPLEDWSREEVLAYLKKQMGELPEHFALDHSSMDCYDCTAYAAHSHDRVAWMKARHPELYADYIAKLSAVGQAISEPLSHYQRLLRG